MNRFPHAQSAPDPEQVEGIRAEAARLLGLIERCNVQVTPYFIATLRKLADNPVRKEFQC
jgi:hypothetical protein